MITCLLLPDPEKNAFHVLYDLLKMKSSKNVTLRSTCNFTFSIIPVKWNISYVIHSIIEKE